MDLIEAVRQHEERFNAAVRANDYTEFLATFTDDAVMAFDDRPIGPFRGRAAIAQAYAVQPPTDTMTVNSIEEVDPETVDVHFDWDSGGGGTMRVRWREGQVAHTTIAFRE
jgi:ketosteroid isomerase-like protein